MGGENKINIPNIPEDLITEILLLLPIKALGKFQLVCKNWQSLISSPLFHKLHLQFTNCEPPTSSYLLAFGDANEALFSLNVKHKNNGDGNDNGVTITVDRGSLIPLGFCRHSEPIGSCNGLVCFQNSMDDAIYVLNPVTKKRRLFPYPFTKFGSYSYIYASGFGFVPSINDYKVVVVIKNPEFGVEIKKQVVVLSLKNDKKWRKLGPISFNEAFSKQFPAVLASNKVVNFNEALYWIVVPEQYAIDHLEQGAVDNYFLVKFDLVEEIFERVSNLEQINDDYNIQRGAYGYVLLEASIGVIRQDTLCVCQLYHSFATQFGIDMWTLEQYGKWDSWKRLYKVKLDTNCMELPMHASKFWGLMSDSNVLELRRDLIGFMSNCNVLVRLLITFIDREGEERLTYLLVLVDPSQDPPTYHFSVTTNDHVRNAASYVPSLISPCNVSRQDPPTYHFSVTMNDNVSNAASYVPSLISPYNVSRHARV